jgi:hypothetical protein
VAVNYKVNIMPVRTLNNPYRGINAHLHSLAQNPQAGSPTIWTSIHAMHIGHLIDALNERLPAGYVARPEQSLQIWSEDEEGAEAGKRSPRPDAAIFPSGVTGTPSVVAGAIADSPVLHISIREFLEREITIPSGVIYKVEAHEIVGKPVARIELLSASNKRGGFGYRGYLDNRWLALSSGTSLVEMDYLHQTVSPLPGVPAYPDRKDSHAYTIAVTDRRLGKNPDDEMLVYIMDVDQQLPTQAEIPLAEDDSITFDFEAVYQHTFNIGRWGLHIDYEELPRNFESYSPADQQRIRQVMERARQELN